MIDEDHCVYIKQHKDKYALLSLYVDERYVKSILYSWSKDP